MRYLAFAPVGYSFDIMRPLQAEARRRGDDFAWFTLDGLETKLSDDETHLPDINAVQRYNPDAVLSPVHWVPYFFPGIKVQVFHGFDLDKHGNDDHFRIRGWFDLYLTQGPSTTERFKRLADKHGYFDVQETGWAKLDPLFRADPPPRPKPGDKPTILYASTFSRNVCSIPDLSGEIKRLIGSRDWHWLLTTHPKTKHEWVTELVNLQATNAELVRDEPLIPVIKAADVIVCDTSSIVYEFLLQGRPAVTYRNLLAGPHLIDIQTAEALESAIESALTASAGTSDAIEQFGQRIHPYRDGQSAARSLDAIERHRQHFRPRGRKPNNLFRKFKVKRKLLKQRHQNP